MKSDKPEKVVLITGGTRGVGRAVATELAGRGPSLFLLNYLENHEAAESTRMILEKTGSRVRLLRYNLAFPEQIAAMFEEIRSETEYIDRFVHCAAITAFKPLSAVRANQWDLTFNVAARAFLLCTQACVPLMKEGGKIVAVSSTGSRRFNLNYGALGAAKSALETIVQYLAVELAPKNIRINGVTAGLLQGENLPPFPDVQKIVDETLRRTPAGRLGSPEDVAQTVRFLLEEADWICGQNIVVDGGFCIT